MLGLVFSYQAKRLAWGTSQIWPINRSVNEAWLFTTCTLSLHNWPSCLWVGWFWAFQLPSEQCQRYWRELQALTSIMNTATYWTSCLLDSAAGCWRGEQESYTGFPMSILILFASDVLMVKFWYSVVCQSWTAVCCCICTTNTCIYRKYTNGL